MNKKTIIFIVGFSIILNIRTSTVYPTNTSLKNIQKACAGLATLLTCLSMLLHDQLPPNEQSLLINKNLLICISTSNEITDILYDSIASITQDFNVIMILTKCLKRIEKQLGPNHRLSSIICRPNANANRYTLLTLVLDEVAKQVSVILPRILINKSTRLAEINNSYVNCLDLPIALLLYVAAAYTIDSLRTHFPMLQNASNSPVDNLAGNYCSSQIFPTATRMILLRSTGIGLKELLTVLPLPLLTH